MVPPSGGEKSFQPETWYSVSFMIVFQTIHCPCVRDEEPPVRTLPTLDLLP